jgi:hypothetical protein
MQVRPHLTDEELLRAIDRELPAAQHTSAAAHLVCCADCRARQGLIDGAAARFTELYRQERAHERTEDARDRLRSRMLELATAAEQPGSLRRVAGVLLDPRLITVVAVAAAIVLIFRVGVPSPAASGHALAAVERTALPVASLTPGATWNVSLAELCTGGARAREQRPIPSAVRQRVLREYRMDGVPADEYELDYLITPELGGAPDPRNLWPQRYVAGAWNARVKDDLERLLPRLVCDGRVNLEAAQRDLARDWIAAYRKYFHTDAPLQRWARLSSGDDTDEADGMTYPVWRTADAPGLRLISFPVRP